MKRTKTLLAGVIVMTVMIPSIVQAASHKSYSAADHQYLKYNGHYFTLVEKAASDAKGWYFNNHAAFLSSVQKGTKQWWNTFNNKETAWNNVKANAYRPVDIPAKFSTVNKYFKRAVSAMNDGKVTFNQYVNAVAYMDRYGHKWSAKTKAAESSKIKSLYNRFQKDQKTYTFNKDTYCKMINQMNKVYH
jgi:hypothetical protein